MTRSALVVVVPEAEPLVATHRAAHDPMAARGVPAHVTVLHPFRAVVDDVTAAAVETIAAGLEPFDASFAEVGRFPGDVVYLVPSPLERFRQMTRAFVEAFPECPPYGGAFPDPHPHLTVGSDLDPATADALGRAMKSGLPIVSRVDHLTLLVEDDEAQWSVDRSWPLKPLRPTTCEPPT